jgi:hypothetical protein
MRWRMCRGGTLYWYPKQKPFEDMSNTTGLWELGERPRGSRCRGHDGEGRAEQDEGRGGGEGHGEEEQEAGRRMKARVRPWRRRGERWWATASRRGSGPRLKTGV